MQLEEINDVKHCGNGVIVELDNGFALAYEKRTFGEATHHRWGNDDKKSIVTALLTTEHPEFYANGSGRIHLRSFTLDSLVKSDNNIPYPADFSDEFIETLKHYTPTVSHKIKDYNARIQSAYKKLLDQLGVEKYSAKDWTKLGAKSVLASVGTVVGFGFLGLSIALFPFYLYGRFTKKETQSVGEYFAGFFRHHGDIDLIHAVIVIAAEFPFDVYRSLFRKEYKCKIHRKDLLQKTPDGNNAALVLYNFSQTVSHGGGMGTPERFTGYEVIFSDGLDVNKHFAKKRDHYKKDYSRTKLFFNADTSLKSEIETCLEAIETEKRGWQDFAKQLDAESQNELLKKIGFVS